MRQSKDTLDETLTVIRAVRTIRWVDHELGVNRKYVRVLLMRRWCTVIRSSAGQ